METVAENSGYVLIYKPAGMAVESRDITVPDLCHLLKNRYRELSVINRLDQPVEGLVLFAKDKRCAASLSEQMRSGKIRKEYLCVVCGRPEEAEGTLRDLLLKDSRTNTSKVVREGTKGAKKAELRYTVLASREIEGGEYTLVKILLKTGRHHQIRAQFAHLGCPLAGDRKYGQDEAARRGSARQAAMKTGPDIRFPALCAYRLTFTDPVTEESVSFTIQPEGKLFRAFNIEETDL